MLAVCEIVIYTGERSAATPHCTVFVSDPSPLPVPKYGFEVKPKAGHSTATMLLDYMTTCVLQIT